MTKRTVKRIALWTVGIVTTLVIMLAVMVVLIAGDVLRNVANKQGSGSLGRDFSIQNVKIDWDWSTPFVHIDGIKLSNLPNSKYPDMVSIDQVNFHIRIWRLLEAQMNLPDIEIVKPQIVLEKFDANTKNWEFPSLSKASAVSNSTLPSHRGNFPVIDNLTITDGKMIYHDATKNLNLDLGIETAAAGGGEKGEFKFGGNGTLQNKPFNIDAQGGSLDMLRNSSEAYPLNLKIVMGETSASIQGTFTDPVKMEGIDTKLDLKGDNLADLFYLTTIPLPPTPHYELSGHLTKTGNVWAFEDFRGKVGNSDLNGKLSDDLSGERGYIKADLNSKLLDMKDLAGFVGATPEPKPGEKTSQKQMEQVHKEQESPRLLPDVPINLDRLRTADMDVHFTADKIVPAGGVPIENMDVTFHLKDGILRIDPLSFGVALGHLSGSLVLNGQQPVPQVSSDLTLTKLSLKNFFSDPSFAHLTNGYFGGHFVVAGTGKSLAEILGNSNGNVSMVMSGGSVSELIVDAAGLDIGGAAPILIGKDKAAGVRCAVMDFKDQDGILNSDIFVFDTTVSNIGGEAHINLKDETIKAQIKGEPKNPSVTVHTAITIDGPLKKPSIGLDPEEPIERGAAAAVLSVFLTPIAAIIPFIEIGVGEDSDCNSLIGQAKQHAEQSSPPAPPSNGIPATATPASTPSQEPNQPSTSNP